MGKLTTHILDTANGCPAHNVSISLYRIEDNQRHFIKQAITNDDGRVDSPLLADDISIGQFELEFAIGDYFREKGHEMAEPAFVDQVVLRFGIADVEAHYHVPLLATPWSYSTYRGS